jgi:23S rRNA (adenine2503-C2)-methyltransferase
MATGLGVRRLAAADARLARGRIVSLPLLYDLTLPELETSLSQRGWPAYRARQVWQAVYRQLVSSPDEMTTLPHSLRHDIAGWFRFDPFTVRAEAHSHDHGTEKVLIGVEADLGIEAVLMRYDRRRTACISTQVGCAMGCVFCATGQMGFHRNLTAGEIVSQVLHFARRMTHEGHRLTNLVVMGMGEPFLNYDATMRAIDILNDAEGFHFGARRITLSTVGIIPGMERFAAEKRQVNLAVSLHAATEELRSRLVPVNRRYPLADLRTACLAYIQQTGRRLSFEWALIEDVNDTEEQAAALAGWLHGMPCHVNLIPLNPTRGYAGAAASRERATTFSQRLEERGIPTTIRLRRGIDIQAGCGQLATQARQAF